MIYDYIIIGGGIAGAVCGYELGKKGAKCIILEKNSSQTEKVCGGGVSYKALGMLENIGINIEPLFSLDSKAIKGHVLYHLNNTESKIYSDGKVSLGIQRNLFDGYLLQQAANKDVYIKYNEKVKEITYKNNIYDVNGFSTKNVIWAIGARSIEGSVIEGQSIGFSGQIYARSTLRDDFFHFWYFDEESYEKYFWVFPIGQNLWNVGVWNRRFDNRLNNDYQNCLKKYFLNNVIGSWEYIRKPKAEFLGHHDQRNTHSFMKQGIGDFAGHCNPHNGGGIHYAIESAIAFGEKDLALRNY